MREMKDSGIAWIGAMPRAWKMNTIAQIFLQVKCKNTGLQEKNLLSLSYGKVKRKSIDTVEGLLPESFDGYNIIEKDDIVLRLTDLQNDHTSLRVGLAEEQGIITSAYLTIRNRSNFCPKYLYYYLHSFDIAKGFYGMGAGVRQGLNWDGVKWLKILAPSVPEQDRIAAFLDAQCAEIDTVLEKTRASIEEYQKLKQSVITQAVTKGIRSDRPMKDSGIEWIGEIPAEWSVVKGRRLILATQNGLTRRDLEKSEGYIVLKLKNLDADGNIDYSEVNRVALTDEEKYKYQLCDGDFLFVRVNGSRNLVGKCAIYHDVGEIVAYNDHIIRVKLNDLCLKEYFHYYLLSIAGKREIELHTSTAAGQFTISGDGLRELCVVLPGIVEQAETVAYLDKKSADIDALIAKKQQYLIEIENYKKSLIYEYVTGKKEVV